jgi:hypothetical protein
LINGKQLLASFFYIELFVHLFFFCTKAIMLLQSSLKLPYFSLFPEVADEPAAEKPAAEKQGSSNDRGKY